MASRSLQAPALVVAVAGGLLLAGPAFAKEAKDESPYAAQVKELRQIKLLLEKADRDYKGHRAAAVKEIGAAIHALQMGHKHPKGPGEKGGGEAQALSDAQLKESIKVLNDVLAQLSKATGEPAAKAVVEITKAVKELEVALTIK